jgi:hypothetical protein
MANKNFSDFTLLTKEINPVEITDYIVGYRPANENNILPQEIQIKTLDLFNSIDEIIDAQSIKANKIQFIPDNEGATSILPVSVNEKLNQFKTILDYPSTDSAAINAYNDRLFIPYGSVVKLYLNNTLTDSIVNTFNAIKNWHIEGLVQIIVASGNWTINEPIVLNHPYGQNIQLIGDTTSANSEYLLEDDALSSVKLYANTTGDTSYFNMFECTEGNRFGLINGFQILGNNGVEGSAIKVDGGSLVTLGASMYINGWHYGIKASNGSTVFADYIRTSGCNYAGIYAKNGSNISAMYSKSYNNNYAVGNAGFGYKAEFNSQIKCEVSWAYNNLLSGFIAEYNSSIKASGCRSYDNGDTVGATAYRGSGFTASYSGKIECYDYLSSSGTTYNTKATGNQGYGAEYYNGGMVYGSFGQMSSPANILGVHSVITNLDPVGGITTVSSDAGALNLKTSDTSSVFIKTNNTFSQVEVLHSVNTVNRLTLKGANEDNVPTVSVEGTANDIGIKISAKGNGYVNLGKTLQLGKFTQAPQDITIAGYLTCQDAEGKDIRLLVAVP